MTYKQELKIGGHRYLMDKVFKNRRDAYNLAKRYRKSGMLARVVKYEDAYIIYCWSPYW